MSTTHNAFMRGFHHGTSGGDPPYGLAIESAFSAGYEQGVQALAHARIAGVQYAEKVEREARALVDA